VGIAPFRRLGYRCNEVSITDKNNAQETASEPASISLYGYQSENILTTIENQADAESQAAFYLDIRA